MLPDRSLRFCYHRDRCRTASHALHSATVTRHPFRPFFAHPRFSCIHRCSFQQDSQDFRFSCRSHACRQYSIALFRGTILFSCDRSQVSRRRQSYSFCHRCGGRVYGNWQETFVSVPLPFDIRGRFLKNYEKKKNESKRNIYVNI